MIDESFKEPLTADSPYKIYDLVPPSGPIIHDPYEAPWSINFKTGLSVSLSEKVIEKLGRISQVTYFRDYDPASRIHQVPIVRKRFIYDVDERTGLCNSRQVVIEWYLVNGEIGPHPKEMNPVYYQTIGEKRDEMQRKRRRQTNLAAQVAVFRLAKTGLSEDQALMQGQIYWATLTNEIKRYEVGETEPLRDRLRADTDPEWVPNVKDFILAVLA